MPNDDKERPSGRMDSQPPDLNREREQLLKSFPRGGKITEEFLAEHARLQARLSAAEAENARLRAKVEADEAVRELLRKIEKLEGEKQELLSRFKEVQDDSTRFSEQFSQVEAQFADMANLFVASNQLHSSMSPRRVTRRIKEVLVQLLGAGRFCMYLSNPDRTELVPIASEGVPGDRLSPVRTDDGRVGQVFLNSTAYVDEKTDPREGTFDAPAAVIPMSIDDTVVGVIAIFSTLSQKAKFGSIDFELFRLLGQHAAGALVSASLFCQAERRMPGLEAFLDLSV